MNPLRLALLALVAALTPVHAAFVTIADPTSGYLSGTNQVNLDPLSLVSPVNSLTSGSLTINFDVSWELAELGSAGFGDWTNYAGSSIESPLPTRVLSQTFGGTYSLSFSGVNVGTFGLELAPYDGFDTEYTVRYFDGATELGSITRTVGFDFIASTPTFYASLVAGSSISGITRIEISTSGGYGPVISQLRWSERLAGDTSETPEPATAALLGLGFAGAVALRRLRR